MTAPENKALELMAARIGLPRPEFERLFDEVSPDGALAFKVTALLSPTGLPFLEALKEARDGGWFKLLADRLAMAGAFDDLAEDSEDDKAVRIELQGIVDPKLGMFDTERLHQGTINARKRLCRVTIHTDPPVHGTGFLVGPQAVLTARHVVESLLDGDGQEVNDSAQLISVHFDEVGQYYRSARSAVMPQWLIASSPRHNCEAPGSPVDALDEADPEEFRDKLDYAVLRLERAKGRERGFYRLDPAREPSLGETNCGIHLYQQPGGGAMHTAPGVGISLWPDAVHTRYRHSANSSGGTSGGLILDKSFEPVAMHQCTFKTPCGTSVVNGAIPTACIAARRDKVEDIVGVDPIWFIAATGQPVVGRDRFQEMADRALTGSTRLIAVRGDADSGKSFTTDILRGMLDEASHLILRLSAADFPLDASRLALLMVGQLPALDPPADMPNVAEADTAPEAWLRDHLLPALIFALRRAAGNRMLWIVIDDLDTHPVGEGTAASLLDRLYADLGGFDFLRIVMIGQRSQPRSVAPRIYEAEDIVPAGSPEVADYLSRRYISEGAVKSPEEITALAVILVNLAGTSPDPRPQAIANAIISALGAGTGGEA